MQFAATWIQPEGIMLCKASQRESNTYQMISLVYRLEAKQKKKSLFNNDKPLAMEDKILKYKAMEWEMRGMKSELEVIMGY